jgi:hypothetical protein
MNMNKTAVMPLEPDFETCVCMMRNVGIIFCEREEEPWDEEQFQSEMQEMREDHAFAKAERTNFVATVHRIIKALAEGVGEQLDPPTL